MQERLEEVADEAVPVGQDEDEQARVVVDPGLDFRRRRREPDEIRSIPDALGQRALGGAEGVVLVDPRLAVRPRLADLEVAVPLRHPEQVHVRSALGQRAYLVPDAFPEAYTLGVEASNGQPDRLREIRQEEIPVHGSRRTGVTGAYHVVTTTAPSLYLTEPSGAARARSLPKNLPGQS